MSWYTGITLGPVYDTIKLTSSPAGLWGASSLFSWIAERLLSELIKRHDNPEAFASQCLVSPCVTWVNNHIILNGCEDMRAKGVGMFHDRIIFKGKEACACKSALDTVVQELTAELQKSADKKEECLKEWLKEYLGIHAIEVQVPEGQAPILYVGELLAEIELEKNFVTSETENPLLVLLENAKADKANRQEHNSVIKDSFLVTDRDKWMLSAKDQSIRDIESIASHHKPEKQIWKTERYYVVLKSDGDGMGALLKNLKNPDEIKDYSSKCLKFCANASEIMLQYGAMPIYAGGDDLMALLPLTGFDKDNNEITVFRLLDSLINEFNQGFEKERSIYKGNFGQPIPTISFGLSIQYVRSPLYEAIDTADSLLFYKAKTGAQNALCLKLTKHSGSPLEIKYGSLDTDVTLSDEQNTEQKSLLGYLDQLIIELRKSMEKKKESEETADINNCADFLSSTGYQLEKHEPLVRYAIKRYMEGNSYELDNLMINLFDNIDQKKFETYLIKIKLLIKKILVSPKNICQVTRKEEYTASELTQLLFNSVRILRFYLEKGGVSK